MQPKERLIVALDIDSRERALELARQLAPYTGMFKVGMELYYSCGPGIVRDIVALGGKVFVDLKLHDIPNTVYRAARVLARLGASMINVHVAGGRRMMAAAVQAVREEAGGNTERPLVTGVTVLTSLEQKEFNTELGIAGSIRERAVLWARMALESGLDGVVASAREAAAVKQACGGSFIVVAPGIRPAGAAAGDQKRIVTPADALKAGADYLVVGRPVTGASDPAAAARGLVQELSL